MSDEQVTREVIALTERLLESIEAGDWATYESLCDPTLTAREPEAVGQLVEGMDFHRHYFELERGPHPRQTTIASPHVRLLGDVAVVTYVRLTQLLDAAGQPRTTAAEETRIWQRQPAGWQHMHFHRSRISRSG